MPDKSLQHTTEVVRMNIVARLLDLDVVCGGMRCGQDTLPVKGSDSATITCPYQVRVQALELPTSGHILFAIQDICGPSNFQV